MKIGRTMARLISEITIDADVPMATFKLTGLGAGAGAGQSVRYEQVVGVYLPLTGGTMAGDIQMGANKLKTTDLLLKQEAATIMALRDLADANYVQLAIAQLRAYGGIAFFDNGLYIQTRNADDEFYYLRARDNGVAQVEVARIQSAADAYFQATLPMVLLPVAIPGTLVEGHFGYDSVIDRLWYRDAAATRVAVNRPQMAASDTLLASADTERTSTSLTYEKKKEISCEGDGTYRVKFSLKCLESQWVYGRIYRNGVAVGIEQGSVSNTYEEKSEDIAGWKIGDRIELYLKRSAAATTAYCSNFRVYGTAAHALTVTD